MNLQCIQYICPSPAPQRPPPLPPFWYKKWYLGQTPASALCAQAFTLVAGTPRPCSSLSKSSRSKFFVSINHFCTCFPALLLSFTCLWEQSLSIILKRILLALLCYILAWALSCPGYSQQFFMHYTSADTVLLIIKPKPTLPGIHTNLFSYSS